MRHAKGLLLSFRFVPFLFLIVPLTEIMVFILVGSQIGVLATIALVILTAVAGSILLRWQGFAALRRIQQELAAQHVPGKELVQGVMVLLAGFLLLTPGFVTDTLGLLLFIPQVRDRVWKFLSSRVKVETFGSGPQPRGRPQDGVIDLEDGEFHREPNRNSPWSPDKDGNRTLH
jgi:UPF0716 protein FxsA